MYPWLKKSFNYVFEFIVVFVGVFLAFWLSEKKDRKQEEKQKQEIYLSIYEDLNNFYEMGKSDYDKGFINFFKNADKQTDSLILIKKIPSRTKVYGDYWKIEIINSLIDGGFLKDIDISIFKKVTRFNTVHKNFLASIEDYNEFYDKHVTTNFDKGIDFFYTSNSNELKGKFLYLNFAFEGMADMAELLVELARELSLEIEEKYIVSKK